MIVDLRASIARFYVERYPKGLFVDLPYGEIRAGSAHHNAPQITPIIKHSPKRMSERQRLFQILPEGETMPSRLGTRAWEFHIHKTLDEEVHHEYIDLELASEKGKWWLRFRDSSRTGVFDITLPEYNPAWLYEENQAPTAWERIATVE